MQGIRRLKKMGIVCGGGVVPYSFSDNFGRADGAIVNGWTGATWTIAGNKAINTPTTSPLTVVNPNMELLTGWVALSTPVSQAQSDEQAHGGTYSWKGVSDSVNDGFYQVINGHTVGRWYEISAWLYVTQGSALVSSNNTSGGAGNNNGQIVGATSTWTHVFHTGRNNLNTQRTFNFKAATAVSVFYGDDAASSELALSSLFCTRDSGLSDIAVSVAITTGWGRLAGVVICLDNPANPQNFIVAYHNGVNVLMEKCVGGTYTTLVNAAATYADGLALKVVKSGTTVKVYYDDVQVGLDQTVSDAGISANTHHGMFGTNSGCTFDDLSMTASDTPSALPTSAWATTTLPQYLNNTAAVMLTFDDTSIGLYNNVRPHLAAHHARASFFVITGQVGTNDTLYVGWWHLRDMQRYGWSIANHTRSHTNLTTLSQADAQTEVANGKSDLDNYGFSASEHLSYPFGGYNATVIAAAQAAGAVTGRTVEGGSLLTLSEATNLMQYGIRINVSGDALATLTGFVDNAVAAGDILVLLMHTVPGNISVADFQALVDYIVAAGLPFITVEDLYAAMSGSIVVPVVV